LAPAIPTIGFRHFAALRELQERRARAGAAKTSDAATSPTVIAAPNEL
jgi:hypothetical protein